jgi:hypothetical protein
MVLAYCGVQLMRRSSAPHCAREKTGGIATAASAVSVMSGSPRELSAALSPGSTRSS